MVGSSSVGNFSSSPKSSSAGFRGEMGVREDLYSVTLSMMVS